MYRSYLLRLLTSSALSLAFLCHAPRFAGASPEARPTQELAEETAAPVPHVALDGMLEISIHDDLSRARFELRLEERSKAIFDELGVARSAEPANRWSVRIEVRGFSRAYDYAVSATLGESHAAAATSFQRCGCSGDELVHAVEAQLREAIIDARQAAAPPVSVDRPTPPPPVVEAPPAQPNLSSPPPAKERRGLGAPAYVGFAALVGGIVLTPIGAVPVGKGDVWHTNSQRTYVDRHRTPTSLAVLGTGVSLLAAGLVLVLVDQFGCKPRYHGCRTRRPAAPTEPAFAFHF